MGKVVRVLRNVYEDPYKWSIVKSVGFFILGVKIALECRGLDFMPPVAF